MNTKEKIEFIKKKIKVKTEVSKYFWIYYGLLNFLSTVVFTSKSNIGRKLNIYEHEKVKKYLYVIRNILDRKGKI